MSKKMCEIILEKAALDANTVLKEMAGLTARLNHSAGILREADYHWDKLSGSFSTCYCLSVVCMGCFSELNRAIAEALREEGYDAELTESSFDEITRDAEMEATSPQNDQNGA